MVERVVVPVLDETGESARLSHHFGRAPFFAIAEIQADGGIENLSFHPNRSEHFGGGGRPPDIILQFQPNVVITFGMGPRAIRRFQSVGVAVMQAKSETLSEVLSSFIQNELTELTEGCREARHK
jgi:predicted Fe-Mo cluster-binding NifX family protein